MCIDLPHLNQNLSPIELLCGHRSEGHVVKPVPHPDVSDSVSEVLVLTPRPDKENIVRTSHLEARRCHHGYTPHFHGTTGIVCPSSVKRAGVRVLFTQCDNGNARSFVSLSHVSSAIRPTGRASAAIEGHPACRGREHGPVLQGGFAAVSPCMNEPYN